MVFLLVIPQILVVIVVKGPAYQEDSSRSSFSCHSRFRSWALNAEEMEKIAPPFPNLFPRLGVG